MYKGLQTLWREELRDGVVVQMILPSECGRQKDVLEDVVLENRRSLSWFLLDVDLNPADSDVPGGFQGPLFLLLSCPGS